MRAFPSSQSREAPRRRGALAGSLLALLALAGVAVWAAQRPPPPPVPPGGHFTGKEPKVLTAVRAARERVLKEPRSAKAWGEYGEVLIANEMDEDSRVCFAEAERLDPVNPRWPYYQAGTLVNRGEREEALPLLHRSIQRGEARGEDNPVPRLLLAETLLTLGRLDEAEAQFGAVLRQHPDDVRGQFGMGLLCLARQDWRASREYLLRCLGSPQARQKASLQLALVSQRLGDAAEADKFRKQADRLPKDNDWTDPYVNAYLVWAVKTRARYRLADTLESSGQYAKAADVLRPLVAEFPNDYLPHVTLGKVLGRLQEYGEAETILRYAVELAPEKVQVHYYLGLILFTEAELLDRQEGGNDKAKLLYKEAESRLRQALAIKPDYGFAHMCLGRCLKNQGRPEAAVDALRQAARCSPEFAEIHYRLAEVLIETKGPADEARHHLEQALELGGTKEEWRPAAVESLEALRKGKP